MKKVLMVTTIVVLVIASLSVVGYAFAQTQTPSNPDPSTDQYAPGWRANGGMMGAGGMMGGRWNRAAGASDTDEYGPMHEYMIAALAQAFNLTPEELEARHDAGDTMWEIASEQGLDAEQFRQVMLDARTQALNDAVAAGAITQEQADWMLSHMSQMGSQGYGPGSAGCPGMAGNSQGRMGGGRWNR